MLNHSGRNSKLGNLSKPNLKEQIWNLVLASVTLLGVDLNKRHANLILQEFQCAIA